MTTMLSDAGKPDLFLLHALGGTARSWDPVIAALGGAFRCVPLDIPGFGARSNAPSLTVEEMADWATAEVLAFRPARWMLVGHSMGGKLATLVTARAEAGASGLVPPSAIVLVAASPPAVEPMDEVRRAEMIGWCAAGPISEDNARRFVEANIAGPLPEDGMAAAVADVRRAGRNAWLAWLERGSLEDWSDAVGTLRTPALIVAGGKDGDLGAESQRRLNVPHYENARVETVTDAAHLIPVEKPEDLARLIADHWSRASAAPPLLPGAFERLIASDRVGARTREALLGRLAEPAPGSRALDEVQRALLAALLARVLPQRGTSLDLAGRIDADLASGPGDGWRFAELPPDAQAWRQGLDTLGALAGDFAGLSAAGQDDWIRRMIDGQAGIDGTPGRLSGKQMQLWFEDVRGEAVRIWVSHPAAMARIGYDGFANGGDGRRKQGFLRTHADEREDWQEDWRGASLEMRA